MKDTAFEIFKLTKTKQDLDFLDQEIDLISEALFKKEIKEFIKKEIRVSTIEALRKDFPDFETNPLSIKDNLEKIKQEIGKFKILKLTIAFEPTEEILGNILDFVRANFGEQIVLDYEVDKNILGGAVVVYEGFYEDYSLGKVLEETLQTKREEIMGQLA